MSARLGTSGRTCAACRYYAHAQAQCRFTSPSHAGWPHARSDEWCGEWTAERSQMQPIEEAAHKRGRFGAAKGWKA